MATKPGRGGLFSIRPPAHDGGSSTPGTYTLKFHTTLESDSSRQQFGEELALTTDPTQTIVVRADEVTIVARYPDRLIGFAFVHPQHSGGPGWAARLSAASSSACSDAQRLPRFRTS
ncbi:MAG: hypothetical protein MUD01_24395 [Chloroflexaceae bacterium]|nr:hypothetical protein [Chloroflexaceae bacterium]